MDLSGTRASTCTTRGDLGRCPITGTGWHEALYLATVNPVVATPRAFRDGADQRSRAKAAQREEREDSMPNFEIFSRSLLQLKAEPQITLLRRGNMSLNRPAYAALGCPDAVELLYDTCERIIGLRPADPRARNAYVVRQPAGSDKGPFVITAMAFTKFYDVDTSTSLRRNAYLDDGVLCMCLNDAATAVTSNRARISQAGAQQPTAAQGEHLPDLGAAESSL
jgi:hypothetical protein